jgi:hypothetical protein
MGAELLPLIGFCNPIDIIIMINIIFMAGGFPRL